MDKWNEPPIKAPSWLDEKYEVHEKPAPRTRNQFTVDVIDTLITLGFPFWQACEITGNSINETGGKGHYRGHNLGGYKITRPYAEAFLAKHGRKPPFWRARGNKAKGATLQDYKGGDPPWCFYRAFDSDAHYLADWGLKFVPKPDPKWTAEFVAQLEKNREATADYRLTGYLFWKGDPRWFVALCDAGYKGANTDKNPLPSYAEHLDIVRGARHRWAQTKLGIWALSEGIDEDEISAVDGEWGRRSGNICARFQAAHGLPATRTLDDATAGALAAAKL
jgi:hypothetical protein